MDQEPLNAPRTIPEFLRYTWRAIVAKRRWALLVLWLLLVMVAVLLKLAGGPDVLPAIYVGF